ncbi:FRG domain-containing protein [Candidatus Poriferisodalis sp.]|uniref:FRG domain-containing protein n=1 Tax=Candidatus Poriferisodalis sp. TaxID=3101277 RepID=UPI003B01990A
MDAKGDGETAENSNDRTIGSDDFFGPWEPAPIQSLDEFLQLIRDTFSRWSSKDVHYAWRGVQNAGWPLHSALYRRMIWTNPHQTYETSLERLEGKILADANRWGLHFLDRAHLPVLYQLAMLQHFGAPTRLIDVTFNPLIALYFAVEAKEDTPGTDTHASDDGRLFIFDVSNRLINESNRIERQWELVSKRPWRSTVKGVKDWSTRYWAWRPAAIEARFSAQNSGFIFGGVPKTGSITWPKSTLPGDTWGIETVKRFTSVPLRLHKLEMNAGRPPHNPTMTVRVDADAKVRIREELGQWFDIEARTVFPDYPGFAERGVSGLKRGL